MKLLIASDLHFEFHADNGKSFIKDYFCDDDYDVLVLAGDIQLEKNLKDTMTELSKIGKPVIFVPGNHEYYYSSLPQMTATMEKIAKIPNIYPLDNQIKTIDGFRFLGSTLWVTHSLISEPLDKLMNCFKTIKGLVDFLGPKHQESVKFINENLKEGDVVITHHLPHKECIHPKFAQSNLNRYYMSHLGPLVEERGAKLWIHGHSHESMDQLIGNTRVIRNPFGYHHLDLNLSFTRKIVEI